MWKAVGSINSGDEQSVRSNRSRMDINTQPFHQSLKRRSNVSPQTNRSFCYEYFEKRRNNTMNMTSLSNKSQKEFRGQNSREDLFTEMRNKASKEGISQIDSLKENPEGDTSQKGRDSLIQVFKRLNTLKKDQRKLRVTLENEFNSFKNFFYQIEEKNYQKKEEATQPTTEVKVDEQLFKGLLGEAFEIEKYFGEMDRKKTTIMQQLAG